MAATLCLGAEGVQIGSLFAATLESSAHSNFKNAIINSNEGDTELTLKELVPVRLLKNDFYQQVQSAYQQKADVETLKSLLSRGRAKKGMFEGDMIEGELEIGQVSAGIQKIKPVAEVMQNIITDFNDTIQRVGPMKL